MNALPSNNITSFFVYRSIMKKLKFIALVSITLLILPRICIADCSSPPRGFGGAWARQYKQWCESCCGTYSSTGPSCNPGNNWGCGQQGGSTSIAPSYDYEAERQRQLEVERQRQRELEEQRKQEEEKAKKRQEEFERNKQEALQSMKGISDGELGLKGTNAGGLGLKDINDDKSGLKDAASYDIKNLNGKKDADKIKIDKEKQQSEPFQKGLRDASQCYESTANVYCLSVSVKERNKCVELYQTGFSAGMRYQKTLLNAASFYGKRDKEDGKKNQSFNHPNAEGPCRVKWVESYNRGYFAGKALIKN
jgi:hypothetical protein